MTGCCGTKDSGSGGTLSPPSLDGAPTGMIGSRSVDETTELPVDVDDATTGVDGTALAGEDGAASAGAAGVAGADGVAEAGADAGADAGVLDGATAAGALGTLITTVTGDGAGH